MILTFDTPITIVCGLNAAGKSRLIRQSLEAGQFYLSRKRTLTENLAEQINGALADMKQSFRIAYHPHATGYRSFHYPERDFSLDAKFASFGENKLADVLQHIFSTHISEVCYLDKPEEGQHPLVQAQLGSVIAQNIYKAQKFIIETHSELMILRLLRLIRTKMLDKDMVSVYVLHKHLTELPIHNPGLCTRMFIDNEGEFTSHWPGGFFDERAAELF